MRYDYWGRPQEQRPFYEKAWSRIGLDTWDNKWHTLSPRARITFLDTIQGPGQSNGVSREKFPAEPLKELLEARLVILDSRKNKSGEDYVVSHPDAADFAARVRALKRYHLLAPENTSELLRYTSACFYSYETHAALSEVLRKAGIAIHETVDSIVQNWVPRRYWVDWALKALKSPLGRKIVEALQAADGPIPIAELTKRFPDARPPLVREALNELVSHLVVFEDLRPGNWDLIVGLLPSVRQDIVRAARPRIRPPLVACPNPREVAVDGSMIVNDLRAFLLEVAGEPPRLKQDHFFFAKEVPHFLDVLDPQPPWLSDDLRWSGEERINEASTWAKNLKLVSDSIEAKELRMNIASRGQEWLGASLEEQYSSIYANLNALPKNSLSVGGYYVDDDPDDSSYPGIQSGDQRFLGAHLTAVPVKGKNKEPYSYWQAKPEDYQALRDALFSAFEELPIDVFHQLDSVISHFSFGASSPLNLGRPPDEVSLSWNGRFVFPLEEEREKIARQAFQTLLAERLIPLGTLRLGVDPEGKLCIARTPRLAAYFGRKGAKIEFAGPAVGESRVVVQPDFSVIVIGLNPAPAAALAPFCVRSTKQAGSGAIVFKLTRESVIKAVSHGLKGSEIVARLNKYASIPVPPNVLREVEGWCDWVRELSTTSLTVLRCGNRETADRVASALGKNAERLGDSVVAITSDRLTPAERTRLQSQGIIVQGKNDAKLHKPKAKPKKRRSYY